MDTQIPQFVTHQGAFKSNDTTSTRESLAELRDKYAQAEAARQQAVDAQRTAEAQLRREQEQHQETRDDRDFWSSFAHDLLAEKIRHTAEEEGIDPGSLDTSDLEAIADSLADDRKHGSKVADLRVAAKLADWEADR